MSTVIEVPVDALPTDPTVFPEDQRDRKLLEEYERLGIRGRSLLVKGRAAGIIQLGKKMKMRGDKSTILRLSSPADDIAEAFHKSEKIKGGSWAQAAMFVRDLGGSYTQTHALPLIHAESVFDPSPRRKYIRKTIPASGLAEKLDIPYPPYIGEDHHYYLAWSAWLRRQLSERNAL